MPRDSGLLRVGADGRPGRIRGKGQYHDHRSTTRHDRPLFPPAWFFWIQRRQSGSVGLNLGVIDISVLASGDACGDRCEYVSSGIPLQGRISPRLPWRKHDAQHLLPSTHDGQDVQVARETAPIDVDRLLPSACRRFASLVKCQRPPDLQPREPRERRGRATVFQPCRALLGCRHHRVNVARRIENCLELRTNGRRLSVSSCTEGAQQECRRQKAGPCPCCLHVIPRPNGR